MAINSNNWFVALPNIDETHIVNDPNGIDAGLEAVGRCMADLSAGHGDIKQCVGLLVGVDMGQAGDKLQESAAAMLALVESTQTDLEAAKTHFATTSGNLTELDGLHSARYA